MTPPNCPRCGQPGEIKHRVPGVYYCPTKECRVGRIETAQKELKPCPLCGAGTNCRYDGRHDTANNEVSCFNHNCKLWHIWLPEELWQSLPRQSEVDDLRAELANERERAENAEQASATLASYITDLKSDLAIERSHSESLESSALALDAMRETEIAGLREGLTPRNCRHVDRCQAWKHAPKNVQWVSCSVLAPLPKKV